jgi:hypothetical protein
MLPLLSIHGLKWFLQIIVLSDKQMLVYIHIRFMHVDIPIHVSTLHVFVKCFLKILARIWILHVGITCKMENMHLLEL